MYKTLLDIAMIASGVIGYFISIAIVTTPFYKSRANNYLSLSLFLLASLILLEWLDANIGGRFVLLLGDIRPDLLFAATIFTYFLIQIKHPYLNNPWYKLIYLPFIGSAGLEICIYLVEFIVDGYSSILHGLIFFVKDFASIGFNVFLILFGRRLLRKSTLISEDKRRWLLRLNLFVICIILIWILTRVEAFIFQTFNTTKVLWIMVSLFLWWVLYYGIFRLQVIVQKEEIHEYLVSKKTAGRQIKNKINHTKTTNVSKVITELYQLMEEEEIYKDPLLSRLDIAKQLGISERNLSQIINQEINKSVIQFVNEHRVEAAKHLLLDPVFNKYSVEAIGMEVGFKSKSAFYNAFNMSLEMSPGAFKKLQKTS